MASAAFGAVAAVNAAQIGYLMLVVTCADRLLGGGGTRSLLQRYFRMSWANTYNCLIDTSGRFSIPHRLR
jgi:hypothetical protein